MIISLTIIQHVVELRSVIWNKARREEGKKGEREKVVDEEDSINKK
jgi:hypothetical protein